METFWLEDERSLLPSARVQGTPDVRVVGGGVTGCSAALALAEAGLGVVLHEAREIAAGASGRNGGFALRGGAMPYNLAREWLGPARSRAYWAWTEHQLERLGQLAGDAFRPVGSLRLAADDEEVAELGLEYEALREDGFDVEWRDQLPPPVGGRFPAGMFHPTDGAIQPARFVRRLARRAAEAGVEIREHSRVDSLEDVAGAHVLVATDGYPSGLLGELEGSIIPTRGQMIATEPIRERLFECPHYGRHGFDYWQQWPDGRILAGGFRDTDLESEFTADEETTPPIQRALEEFVAALVGRPVEVTHRWAGIFGLVLDFLPVVGRHPHDERVWIAGGYSGHGNVLGFGAGRLVADAILGRNDPLLELFDPLRLEIRDAV